MTSHLATSSMRTDTSDLKNRRAALLGPAYRLFYEPDPLHIVRGEGAWLWDAHGRRYLDAYNNVASIGHCNPSVVNAIAEQAAVLNTHTRYLHDLILDYAEQLLATTPQEIDRLMLTSSGSEANDLALRIAQYSTGASGVIATCTAYHGGTLAVAQFSPSLGSGNPIGDHVRLVDPPRAVEGDEARVRFGRDVEAAAEDLKQAGHGVGAIYLDSILASDGIFSQPPDAFVDAVTAVRDAGGLYIADEVQAGFGRTGEMWGFSQRGLVPDMITLGKPMGNGHPIAGLMLRSDYADGFGQSMRYFNTLAGNPVSCAAALAVLSALKQPGTLENVRVHGRALHAELESIAANASQVREVSGTGLFFGAAIVDPGTNAPDGVTAAKIVARMKADGVLVGVTGPEANVLKIRPPLIVGPDEISMISRALNSALDSLTD